MTSISGRISLLAQKSSISCVSRIHPMRDPAKDLRPKMSEKAFTDRGSAGAPTFTRDPPTERSERYASTSIFALTVLRIRSKYPARSLKVCGSLVAKNRSAQSLMPSSFLFKVWDRTVTSAPSACAILTATCHSPPIHTMATVFHGQVSQRTRGE